MTRSRVRWRRARRIGAALAALVAVGGSADGIKEPVRITAERMFRLGEGFLEGPVRRHLERQLPGETPEQVARAVALWQERTPCEVPRRAPLGPVEVESWFESGDLDGERATALLEDGWGRPLEVWLELRGLDRPLVALRSAGADGRFEGPVYRVDERGSTAGSDDFVWTFDGFCWAPAIGLGEPERPPRSEAGDGGGGPGDRLPK